MSILNKLSNIVIPVFIFYIIATGITMKKNIYEDFIKGAADGIQTVFKVMPTLIGLMVAVGILRASGFLDFLTKVFSGVAKIFHFPAELFSLVFIRMFSSSAATGMVLDIFKEYGTDSRIGLITSIMMSCTETIFYTMSVYFMAAKVTKTRWTLTGALISTLAGIISSVLLAQMIPA